ncbi:MAG: Na+/H+ antiporter subunit E, partial [Gammaproteobacteria bacterium]|nr:Na+/H+ antiporter subunit E [Gammaproteobacteria bacterium]
SILWFAVLWWLISHGSLESWLIGVPAVAAAVWTNRRLKRSDKQPLSLPGLLRFIPFFLWESLRGGTDVALRTLAPRLRIRAGFLSYHCNLDQPASRILFAYCVSLLPGTLAADLQDGLLEVHVLDLDANHRAALGRLESAIEQIFQTPGGTCQ